MVKMFEVKFVYPEKHRFFKCGVIDKTYLARKTKANGICVKTEKGWQMIDNPRWAVQPFSYLFEIVREFYVPDHFSAINHELGDPEWWDIPDGMKSPYGKRNEIFRQICDWQMDAGESFTDYFDSSINVPNFMFWCLGKGWITQEQFHAWEDEMKGKGRFDEPSSMDVIEGGELYSISNEDNWEKGYMALAHFMSESKTYQRRLKKFLDEYNKVDQDEANEEDESDE